MRALVRRHMAGLTTTGAVSVLLAVGLFAGARAAVVAPQPPTRLSAAAPGLASGLAAITTSATTTDDSSTIATTSSIPVSSTTMSTGSPTTSSSSTTTTDTSISASSTVSTSSAAVTSTALTSSATPTSSSTTTSQTTSSKTTTASRSTSAPGPATPLIRPRTGHAFRPKLGDWEGTVDGFPASFQLSYDRSLPQHAGVPQYGLSHIVMLRPAGCPPNADHYAETIIDGQTPGEIGGFGTLALTRFGIDGSFTGARTATFSTGYATSSSCTGHLIWHMRPAVRHTVDDGAWSARFRDGETERFAVMAGGRLATGFTLPRLMTACNGLSGGLDVFIGASGTARYAGTTLLATIRFGARSASGTLNAAGHGCPGGPVRFTATQNR